MQEAMVLTDEVRTARYSKDKNEKKKKPKSKEGKKKKKTNRRIDTGDGRLGKGADVESPVRRPGDDSPFSCPESGQEDWNGGSFERPTGDFFKNSYGSPAWPATSSSAWQDGGSQTRGGWPTPVSNSLSMPTLFFDPALPEENFPLGDLQPLAGTSGQTSFTSFLPNVFTSSALLANQYQVSIEDGQGYSQNWNSGITD